MADEPRPRLGRGLAALIGDASVDAQASDRDRTLRRVPIESLRPNPRNPRRVFEDSGLDELANSIREKGILQPIVVREVDATPGVYEIVAGERRWRAAQRAAQHRVPIVVVEATNQESLELAIVENVQRTDLNPLEEADGYAQLIHDFGYTQLDLAKIICKSRSHVANTLRLTTLPDSVRDLVSSGRLSAGHARALLGTSEPDRLAQKIITDGLTVRDAERLAQAKGPTSELVENRLHPRALGRDANTLALEKSLQESTGLVVEIRHRGEAGQVRIQYSSLEQLDEICIKLSSGIHFAGR